MDNAIVFEAIEHQPIIGAKTIRVDDALWNDFGSDDLAQVETLWQGIGG
jgi:hypothetical protein